MNAPLASGLVATCPCCGQSIADIDRPIVDDDHGLISWLGHTVLLPRGNVTKIAKSLARHYPRGRTVHQLAFDLWGGSDREPGFPEKNIHVHVSQLRQFLRSAPFTISRIVGGYERSICLVRRDLPSGIRADRLIDRQPPAQAEQQLRMKS